MHGMVPLDPQTRVSQLQYAIVYLPNKNIQKKRQSKRSNKRFPAGCVDIRSSKESAITDALKDDKRYAAIVVGPSKSSEGQFIYYLQKWL